jgi:hypothetical protein
MLIPMAILQVSVSDVSIVKFNVLSGLLISG